MIKSIVFGAIAMFSYVCVAAADDPISAWIFHPGDMPGFRPGFNNCTIPFAPNSFLNPDGICWQRAAGHDGYYRQQIQGLHVLRLPACGGGPGDIDGIRVCRVPDDGGPLSGQFTPCGTTGDLGCKLCQTTVEVTCN